MNLKNLKKALAYSDNLKRVEALEKFRDTEFGIEALPLLRKALDDKFVTVVIRAAECIAKLGPEALACPAGQAEMLCGVDKVHADLGSQLANAGGKIWGYSGYNNCYGACLDALVKLKYEDQFLIEYIHAHIGIGSPDDLLHSLNSLKTIGSPVALSLFKRAVTFWLPELNKTFAKKVQVVAASVK